MIFSWFSIYISVFIHKKNSKKKSLPTYPSFFHQCNPKHTIWLGLNTIQEIDLKIIEFDCHLSQGRIPWPDCISSTGPYLSSATAAGCKKRIFYATLNSDHTKEQAHCWPPGQINECQNVYFGKKRLDSESTGVWKTDKWRLF